MKHKEDRVIEHRKVRRGVKQALSHFSIDDLDNVDEIDYVPDIWKDSAHTNLERNTMLIGPRSYGKIYNLGHIAVQELFVGPVHVQEKVDGSQFSFGIYDGVPKFRSKKAELHFGTPDKLFGLAVETAMRLIDEGRCVDGWTYRGEAITTPKHNTLTYDRIPNGGLILFDVDRGDQDYCSAEELATIAGELGVEHVPTFYFGEIIDVDMMKDLLNRTSFLGGPLIEGIVIKNYSRFGADGRVIMGKWVSEEFREKNKADFGKRNPTKSDSIEKVIDVYRNKNRWLKAVQHLREEGKLELSPRDIGGLMKEVAADIREEDEDEIKQLLFDAFWPSIKRGVVRGLPEWYKNEFLLSLQKFSGDE